MPSTNTSGEHGARDAVERTSFSPDEPALLRAAGGSFDALRTVAFSAKETFLKAAYGQGRACFDFDAVELAELAAPPSTLTLRGTRTLAAQLRKGQCHLVHIEWLDADTVMKGIVLPSSIRQPGLE